MKKVKRIFNLLLMELSYQYLRINAKIWREELPEHPSLYRKKVEKMTEQAKASGNKCVYTRSIINEVKLSLHERWQAWSEDGATLTTPFDELRSKTPQRLNELLDKMQNDDPPESK